MWAIKTGEFLGWKFENVWDGVLGIVKAPQETSINIKIQIWDSVPAGLLGVSTGWYKADTGDDGHKKYIQICYCALGQFILRLIPHLTEVVENQVAVFRFGNSCLLCKQAGKSVKSPVRNPTGRDEKSSVANKGNPIPSGVYHDWQKPGGISSPSVAGILKYICMQLPKLRIRYSFAMITLKLTSFSRNVSQENLMGLSLPISEIVLSPCYPGSVDALAHRPSICWL